MGIWISGVIFGSALTSVVWMMIFGTIKIHDYLNKKSNDSSTTIQQDLRRARFIGK